MIRMIIVDDEHIILESLKGLIDWKSIGVEVAGSADNGAAAIDLAIKQRPDIILSDISMPCFSGLEMLETLRRNNINTEVIFISAYGKFEFAREAIHYGAFDYILKPIDENQLLSTVSRCADKIRSEKDKQGTGEQDHLDAVILEHLLQAKVPAKAEWELITMRGPDPEKFPNAFVIGFRHEKGCIPGLNSTDFHPCWISVPLRAEEALTMFLVCSPDESGAELVTRINKFIRGYPEMVAAISSTVALKECFEKAYAQISFALIYAEIHRKKGIVLFANLEKSAVSSFPGYDVVCRELSQNIRDGRTDQIQKLLYNFFTGFLEKEILYNLTLVELYCVELVDHIYKENEDYISPSEANEKITLLAVREKISACSGLHLVFNALCEVFMDIYRGIDKDQIHSSMRLVRQCIRIIHEQYGKDISLPDAAKQLYISSNYLSKIFSTEMGKSFSRYLLEYRINMAKKLLRESNDKVYEIAERVGYADVVHFSKIFKQTTGQSPNRYRNQR